MWLQKYYEDVKRGRTEVFIFKKKDRETGEPIYNYKEVDLIVGEEMHMILDNLIDDLENDEYRYDTSFSDELIRFMEHGIRLTKAPFYNVPMKLMLWQKAWIESLFSFKMYDDELEEWVDRFTETLLLEGRKNAKSETSSGLCDAIASVGGEGMSIVCASNTYDQAAILYEACNLMRKLLDPDSVDTRKNREGLTWVYNNNTIRTMSERQGNKEGKNIDFAVVDEVHEMVDDSLITPIVQSMSVKDNKKLIKITTEGFTNNGYLDEDLIKYRKIIKREDTSISAKRKLPWLYTQDTKREVYDTNEKGITQAWQKANPTLIYGVKKWSYLRDQVDEAKKDKAKRMFVEAKDFNFKVINGQAWLEYDEFMYDKPFDIEKFRGCYYLAAVDLAETTDLVSAKAMFNRKIKVDDKYVIHPEKCILSHYWITKTKLEESDDTEAGAKYQEWADKGMLTIVDGNFVDCSIVADWYWELKTTYGMELLKLGYDQRFSNDFINKMEFYGWMDKEHLIRITQSPEVLHLPIKLTHADLKAKLILGLSEIDKWCLGNAALKIDNKEKSLVVKVDGLKAKRIDGAVTLVFLEEMYRRYNHELIDYLRD